MTARSIPSLKIPPHSIEAEHWVLGGLLLGNRADWLTIAGTLQDSDFYRDDHRRIFRAIKRLNLSGIAADVITVSDLLQSSNEIDLCGGIAYLGEIAGAVPSTANIGRHAEIIRDRATMRRLIETMDRAVEQAMRPAAATPQSVVGELVEALNRICPEIKPDTSLLDTVQAARMEDQVFMDELVEDVLTTNGVATLYGASNSGKTFLAIHLAAAIARGIDWFGKRTVQMGVLYLATESPASVRNRIAAYMAANNIKDMPIFVAQKPINLFNGNVDVFAIADECKAIEARYGVRVGLIIGDTMARIAAGANENSGEDMGVVMSNADLIRRETEAAFLWIHHSGKDEAKGARGWSGIRAHIDTEIEIRDGDENGIHSAEITKQRDLNGKGWRIGFRLGVHVLGKNRWGGDRTTCVLHEEIEAPPKSAGKKGRTNQAEPAVLLFLEQRGAGARASEIISALEGKVSRSQIYSALKGLVEDGRMSVVAGIYALRRH